MGGPAGDSYDNALADPIIGLYRGAEVHRRGPWRSVEAEYAAFEWVDWLNRRRLPAPIGTIPLPKPGSAAPPCWTATPIAA